MPMHVFARAAAEALIYDVIDSATATAVDTSLKAAGAGAPVTVRINSPGGDVFAANSILAMLQRRKAAGSQVTIMIDGLAASAASLIAMAGDPIVMPENAMMMIHDPRAEIEGTSAELTTMAGTLDDIAGRMAATYAAKTGLPAARIAEMMTAQTWLTADAAFALGFADRLEQPVAIAARFDLSRYRHPPIAAAATTGGIDARRIYDRHNAAFGKSTASIRRTAQRAAVDPEQIYARHNAVFGGAKGERAKGGR